MVGVGVMVLVLSGFLLVREVKAEKKRKQIRAYQQFVTSEITTGQVLGESTILASGAAGYALLDFYHEAVNHSDVLNVLEQRYPEEMGHANPLDWLQKIEHLESGGPKSVDAYVSGYAGEQSEHLAAATLDHQGMVADSLHPKPIRMTIFTC